MFENIRAFAFDIDGVFTDGSILAMPDGDLLRVYNSKDCFAVRTAVDHGYHVAIITGGCSESIIHRAHSLGVEDCDIFQLSKDKLDDLKYFCNSHNLRLSDVAFVGDDLPDIPAMKACGLGVCPADAVHEVKGTAGYISPFNGGKGCVRDIIEKVLTIQGKWSFDPHRPWKGKHPDNIAKFAGMTGRNAKENV